MPSSFVVIVVDFENDRDGKLKGHQFETDANWKFHYDTTVSCECI